MALSFLAVHPPRTRTASENPVTLHGGIFHIEFIPGDFETSNPSKDQWYFVEHLPPRTESNPQSQINPPYHWHGHQDETFQVQQGTMRVTREGKDSFVKTGETVMIPCGTYHTFYNASSEEEMKVAIKLDPTTRERDETFFRNIHSYLHDCEAASMQPSLPQLLLLLYGVDCHLALPGPKAIVQPLSKLLGFVGGVVIGSWLLGYKASYPEYGHPKAK